MDRTEELQIGDEVTWKPRPITAFPATVVEQRGHLVLITIHHTFREYVKEVRIEELDKRWPSGG